MQKIILIIVLLASLQIIAQTKKNKKTAPTQEELEITLVTSIQSDSLLLTPLIVGNKIFSCTKGNKLSCLDTTGKYIWKIQLSDRLVAQPILDQSIALLGFVNGDLTKIRNDSGEIIESVGIGDSITSNLVRIDYHWPSELMIPKSSNSRNAAVFVTSNGTVHCIDIETLQEYWTNNQSSKIKSQLAFVNNKILFIGMDNSIYCLDAKNGLLIWRWKGNDELVFVNREIVTDGRFIFLLSSDNNLFVIDTLLGKLEWVLQDLKLENALGIVNNVKNLAAITTDKQLLIISIKGQKVLSQIQLPKSDLTVDTPPVEYAEQFFVAVDSSFYLVNLKTNKIFLRNFEAGRITNLLPINGNRFLLTTANNTFIIFDQRKF